MSAPSSSDLRTFEAHRPRLLSLAYRMLGDAARAQDTVQEAWLRWHQRDTEVQSSEAFLVTIVTRLCLNELASARAQREQQREDRLPEPVALEALGLDRLEELDQVSMAFLVMLEKLSPPERAVLLLHDVFDFAHDEIAALIERTPAACRKLLERARDKVATGRRQFSASREEHQRLLSAFLQAARAQDTAGLVRLLTTDAQLITDGGPEGLVVAGTRNLPRPLEGPERIASFVVFRRNSNQNFTVESRDLNGQPAAIFYRGEVPFAAMLLAVVDGKIARVFFHADPARLGNLGPRAHAG